MRRAGGRARGSGARAARSALSPDLAASGRPPAAPWPRSLSPRRVLRHPARLSPPPGGVQLCPARLGSAASPPAFRLRFPNLSPAAPARRRVWGRPSVGRTLAQPKQPPTAASHARRACRPGPSSRAGARGDRRQVRGSQLKATNRTLLPRGRPSPKAPGRSPAPPCLLELPGVGAELLHPSVDQGSLTLPTA